MGWSSAGTGPWTRSMSDWARISSGGIRSAKLASPELGSCRPSIGGWLAGLLHCTSPQIDASSWLVECVYLFFNQVHNEAASIRSKDAIDYNEFWCKVNRIPVSTACSRVGRARLASAINDHHLCLRPNWHIFSPTKIFFC